MSNEEKTANGRVKKVWHGPTTGIDDFIYLVAWLIIGPIVFFIGWAGVETLDPDLLKMRYGSAVWILTFGAGAAGCVLAVLFLIGVRALMKIAGYLKRIEELLSASIPRDDEASDEVQQHHDTGAAGAC